MKNLKKTFAVVLTIAMLVTLFMVPVSAEEKTPAEKLNTLGILIGGSGGFTPEYLEGPATRITSAILLLKLKGLIGDAELWNGTENFADADEALSLYAMTVMGYLKENPDVGFVGYQNMFTPNAVITPQEYYKVLLTALGYEQDVDFTWAEVLTFAASLGLEGIADAEELTINDFAIATVEALDTEVKGTGMTLIEKLVDDGVVDVADAEEAGWSFAPAIASATQVSTNKIEVQFTTSVPEGAVLTLKQGVLIWYSAVTWNADRTVATMTTVANPLNAGAYTVEVTGLDEVMTMDVAVTAPVASSIAVTTNILYANSTEVKYAVYNQFGDVMAIAAIGSAYNQTDSAAIALTPVGTDKFTFAAVPKDKVVVFTVTYGGMVATKTFTVQATPAPSTIAFGTVSPLTGDSYIFVSKTGYVIPYSMTDQYGTPTFLPVAYNAIGIQFISSNNAILDPATIVSDGAGKLTFNTGATAGTVTLTALWNAVPVGQLTIAVNATATPSSATIAAPAVIVAAGEKVSVDITVQDQYGTVHDNASAAVQALDLSASTNCTAVINAATKKLDITATAAGTVTVVVKNGATTIGTMSFTAYAAAQATQVTGATFTKLFQNAGVLTVASGTVTVLDQYGRAFTGGTVNLTGVTGPFTIDNALKTITATGTGTGTVTIDVNGTSTSLVVSIECVADSAIVTYTLTSNKATIYASTNADYHATLTLAGKTAGGADVVLASTVATDTTSSNIAIAKITAGKVEGVAAGTATIYAWNGATLLASTSVTVSTAAPVAQSIAFSATTIANGNNIADILVITDQYGVNIAAAGGFVVATSNSAVINAAGDALVAGTATVTVVKDAVLSPTTTITVT